MPQSLTELTGTESPPESTREEWRRLAKSSPYFLGKLVGFRDLSPDLHGEMSRWICRGTRRKLGLAPRGHYKSSVWTMANNLRRIAADPNIRILLINETLENARAFLARIKETAERNEIFRWLFPEILPDFDKVRWTQDRLEFRRTDPHPQATIEAIGVGGASTSRHYSVIHEDDLVGKAAKDSPAEMSKAIDQHKLAESLLDDPSGEIVTVGTRWHPHDLVAWMEKHEPVLDVFRTGCYRPTDGQPIFPEKFPHTELERIRQKYGPGDFALQYLNRVIATGVTEMDLGDLGYWHWDDTQSPGDPVIVLERPDGDDRRRTYPVQSLERWEMVDPCISPDSGEARSAVVVAGLSDDEPYEIIILDAVARKTDPKTTIDLAWEAHEKWDPVMAGIEIFGAQVLFFYWIPTVYPDLRIAKLPMDTRKSKMTRIRSMIPYMRQKRVWVHRAMTDLLEEMEGFPHGRTVDLLDAFAWGPRIWSPPTPEDDPVDTGRAPSVDSLMDGRSPVTGY